MRFASGDLRFPITLTRTALKASSNLSTMCIRERVSRAGTAEARSRESWWAAEARTTVRAVSNNDLLFFEVGTHMFTRIKTEQHRIVA